MEERTPETRRRVRMTSPAVGFLVGILALAALAAVVVLVVFALGGFGGEGGEGPG